MRGTRCWLIRLIGGLTLLSACGGGNTDPNTPPSTTVSTVGVSPATLTPFQGDTVRLTATARTASGTALSGKTVTWSSSAVSVATVSTTGLVTAMTPGSTTVTATVDGKSGTAQVTVPSAVALDVAHLVTKQVGPKGDSLTTTAANGVTYTLVVPPNAVRTPLTITATPLLSLHGLPFTGGLLAGVELKPSGTVFTQPLTLRIAGAHAIPSGQLLVGFTEPDSGGAVGLEPATVQNGVISILVPHFSIHGAGMAVPADLDALRPASGGQQADLDRVATTIAEHGDLASFGAAFHQWFTRILPILQAGKDDDTAALTALLEYRGWLTGMDAGTAYLLLPQPLVTTIQQLASDANLGGAALSLDLARAIQRANQACAGNRDLNKVVDEWFWQEEAEDLHLLAADPSLSRDSVMAHLCVQVIVTDSTFPATLLANQRGDLHLQFGNQFGSDPNLRNTTFAVRLTTSGTTADGTTDVRTDANGKFDTSVVPVGQVPVGITVEACMLFEEVGTDFVCRKFTIQRGFGRTITGSVGVFTDVGLAGLSDVAKIDGSLTISGVSTIDLHELGALGEVTGNLTIQQAPAIQSFAGLTALRRIGGTLTLDGVRNLPDLSSFPGLQEMGGLTIRCGSSQASELRFPATLSVTPTQVTIDGCSGISDLTRLSAFGQVQSLTLSNLPGLTTLASLHGLQVTTLLSIQGLQNLTDLSGVRATQLQTLGLGNLPGIVSLAPLQGVQVTSFLGIGGLPNLTTLAGVRVNPAMSTVNITDNPELQDLAALAGITSANSSLTIFGNGITTLNELATLTTGGVVFIAGDALTSLAGLGTLQKASHLTLDFDRMGSLHSASLSSLTETALDIKVDQAGTTCAGSGTATVSFPALTKVTNFLSIGGSNPAAGCQINLNFQALANVPGGIGVADGVQDLSFGRALTIVGGGLSVAGRTVRHVDFGGPLTAQTASFQGSLLASVTGFGGDIVTQVGFGADPELLSIAFGSPIHTCQLNIIGNPKLASVSGLSGSTTGCQVVIQNNTSWSTAAINAALANLTIGGQRIVSGNKMP